jgi:rare lipoprotein A
VSTRGRACTRVLAGALGLALGGCFFARESPAPVPSTRTPPAPPPPAPIRPPQGALEIPDAVPRYEPRSPYGNPPFYEVFGKRYFVLSSGADYAERGVASWYGPGFHKVRTSTGEIYDMYGMTAAHKTLPLPAYVRVTNLQNGRSVVVRVNDRGPFVGNRIIDLSYTAAAKLDMLRNGTAMVEVRTVGPANAPGDAGISVAAVSTPTGTTPPTPATASPISAPSVVPGASPFPTAAPSAAPSSAAPSLAGTPSPEAAPTATQNGGAAPVGVPAGAAPIAPAPVTSAPVKALYVQAGAFADPANAERLAAKLRGGGYGTVFIRDDHIAGRRMYRVRIGPVPDVPEFDRIVASLDHAGVHDAHLAPD